MNVQFSASGKMKSIIDGAIVKNSGFNTNYDGNKMKISGYNDGEKYYQELDNDDIYNILSLPSHNLSIVERMTNDFNLSKSNSKKNNKKTSKKNGKKTSKKNNKKTSKKNGKKNM